MLRIQFARVQRWLAKTYWIPDVSLEAVVSAAHHSSLVVGSYRERWQVGYLRVVSDQTTFAWLCDVFVAPAHRRQGLARAMVDFALHHPGHQGLRRWMLATDDAQGVYRGLGFEPLALPEKYMMLRPASFLDF